MSKVLSRLLAAAFAIPLLSTASPVPSSQLVAHWDFENGATNAQGKAAIDGAFNGGMGTSSVDGICDRYGDFDGIDDYVSINGQVLSNFDSDYTITAWFRADQAPSGSTRNVIYSSEKFVLSLGLREGTDTSDTNIQYFTNALNSDPNINVEIPDSEIAGRWIHSALVYRSDGTTRTMSAYVNGVFRETITISSPLDVDPPPSFMNIGTLSQANNHFFQGGIDSVALWDRALTASEILGIANISDNPNDVNGDGNLSVADLAAVQAAIELDPTSSQADVNGDGVVDEDDATSLAQALAAAGATTITVTNNSASGTGSLAAAIAGAGASPGVRIRFDSSLSGTTITLDGDAFAVAADTELFIDTSDLTSPVCIKADGGSIMTIASGSVVAVQNLVFTGASASAVVIRGGEIAATLCTFSGNSGEDGGAIQVAVSGILRADACTFSENTANDEGGAIFCFGEDASFQISRSTFVKNTAAGFAGGGVSLFDSEGEFDRCTFTQNSACARGGAIFSEDSSLVIDQCTVADHLSRPSVDVGSSALIANSIIDDAAGGLTGASLVGENIFNATDHLSPLGYFGGPVMTMHPLAGSPAIDPTGGDTASANSFDARGLPRIFGATMDSGAVEAGPVVTVTSTNDDPGASGTLRTAIEASSQQGERILFDPSLDGGEIALTSGQLTVEKSVFIDASMLAAGLSVSAPQDGGGHRVFEITRGQDVAFHGLEIRGGNVTGGFPSGAGGAILNDSSKLTLNRCTLTENSAFTGGAIYSFGRAQSAALSVAESTLSGNTARDAGGAIYNLSDEQDTALFISRSSISENSAATAGGGIALDIRRGKPQNSICDSTFSDNSASSGGGLACSTENPGVAWITLSGTTFAHNSATTGGAITFDNEGQGDIFPSLIASTLSRNTARSLGGGIFYATGTSGGITALIEDTIIAGNSSPSGADRYVDGDNLSESILGTNLLGALVPVEPEATVANLLLAPLGDYGGFAETMFPLPGSPALDKIRANRSARIFDSRGEKVSGFAREIGATEFSVDDDLNRIAETDWDGDGSLYATELSLGTDPFVADNDNPRNVQITLSSSG